MPKKNQTETVAVLIAATIELTRLLKAILEIHCDGSEPAQLECDRIGEILFSLVDKRIVESIVPSKPIDDDSPLNVTSDMLSDG